MVLGLKLPDSTNRSPENRKNASDTSDNPPYHLIFLLANLVSISWFSGYGAMMQIVRTEVRTPVNNTTENHYNFVVAQPLPSLFNYLI